MDTELLRLGPLLRTTDETSSCVWVETGRPALVEVRYGDKLSRAGTFAVHGHHYALVPVTGLAPGSRTPYSVWIEDRQVWPRAASPFPAPEIRTLLPARAPRVAFGSCRTAVAHDEEGTATHGVDALRTLALRLAGTAPPAARNPELADAHELWPDLLLFLGDQVYADEPSEEMRAFIASRRDPQQPPGWELQDYEEYAELYRLAWSEPAVRWLLSTVPSAMIFDDHDVRDDWNTSRTWQSEMRSTSWWQGRIVAALSSYWVYQHAGNLARDELRDDQIGRHLPGADAPPETVDLTERLDALAARVDRDPTAYRWSYARDLGPGVRLVVVDSRAARVLDPAHRALLDPEELVWLDAQVQGHLAHLLIATSIPFLLARGLHHVEAFSEALAGGAWGREGARAGEWLRQTVDLEHWPAFHDTFDRVARMVLAVAEGDRGRPPRTVTFLSGDVHHSYVTEAWRTGQRGRGSTQTKILQAVCSPMRNPLSRRMRWATALASIGVAGPAGRLVSLLGKVPDGPLRWRFVRRPWFDNNIALLEAGEHALRVRWFTSDIVDADPDHPRLRTVTDYRT